MAVLIRNSPSSTASTQVGGRLAARPLSLRGQLLGRPAGQIKIVKASVAEPYPEQRLETTDHATAAVTGFGGCGSRRPLPSKRTAG